MSEEKAVKNTIMLRVDSSNIAEVGYCGEHSLLLVMFKNGRKFKYLNVDSEKFNALIKADSVGRFFHNEIKGHYDCKPV